MLPPETSLTVSGASSSSSRAGPACSCIQKPLPCLVDQWVNGHSVPFEQPLSIQTDMEYTLDNRMFPGWDPVTGRTEPALIIDTSAMTLPGVPAVGAATPIIPSPVSSPSCKTPTSRGHNNSITTTPTSHHQHHPYRSLCRTRQQHQQAASAAAAVARGGWTTPGTPGHFVPGTPGQAPALPHGHTASYHPAFRPSDPHFPRPTLPTTTANIQPTRAASHMTCDTAVPEQDLMSLIATFEAEPSGYSLDVDWLIGQTPTTSQHATSHMDFTKRDVVVNNTNPHHNHQHRTLMHARQTRLQTHLQQAMSRTDGGNNPNMAAPTTPQTSRLGDGMPACPSTSTAPITTTTTPTSIQDPRSMAYTMFHAGSTMACNPSGNTMAHNDLLTYQGHFYPGALIHQEKVMALQQQHQQQQQQMHAHQQQQQQQQHHHMAAQSSMIMPTPYAPLQRSRPVKRRLPVDSPSEGSLASHHQYCHSQAGHPLTALTMSKRPRWSLSMNTHPDLALHAHVPSPLQARAY